MWELEGEGEGAIGMGGRLKRVEAYNNPNELYTRMTLSNKIINKS